jgi:hypothetical protein
MRRGVVRHKRGRYRPAMSDFGAALALPGVDAQQQAQLRALRDKSLAALREQEGDRYREEEGDGGGSGGGAAAVVSEGAERYN